MLKGDALINYYKFYFQNVWDKVELLGEQECKDIFYSFIKSCVMEDMQDNFEKRFLKSKKRISVKYFSRYQIIDYKSNLNNLLNMQEPDNLSIKVIWDFGDSFLGFNLSKKIVLAKDIFFFDIAAIAKASSKQATRYLYYEDYTEEVILT